MRETNKYNYRGPDGHSLIALPAYVTVLNSGVTPGLRFRETIDSYSLCLLLLPWIERGDMFTIC